ncbi:hypothetical protein A9G48_04020 [Gilliamella sp. wkB18]|uniref:hypothetical protein n=1 Tax=Gilliamella sp. wkB18 TaxID=3120260 RepID=UPI00080E7624|nr:hypothetical protein [Gilliamella apicola]OCG64099.1 hypothetical protein A9G48_04020 [Gilliamella apicola]
MSKLNINQSIMITKKNIIIFGVVILLLFLFTIISLIVSLSNSSRISSNYQTIVSHKVNVSNNVSNIMDNVTVLEQRINSVELEQKKMTIDYDNLNLRSARNEQDIVLLQTVVNDKNLDSRLDNIEISMKNNEIDIDSIKNIQRTQQITLDDIANAFTEFKSQIIQKITTMLSGSKNTTPNNTKKNINVSKVDNFNYTLSSIEYRSGELWAVVCPKKFTSLSELKFLNVGDSIDGWKVMNIENNLVKLINGNQVYTLKLTQ